MAEKKIGKYTIIGEIGKGAMGIVYKAVDPYIGRTVAIKTIRFDMIGQRFAIEEAQSRFMREARSAGNLTHPNIVTVYEVGEDAGLTYIAMEYIDGLSLEDLIGSGRKFSLEEIMRLISQIGDALECAHRKGITHRDVKPGNILIDHEGRPHIVDFGIARLSTSTMTQANMVMGTPFYMSPEQIAGRTVDNRSDIFSLGGILYELLTSHKPFPGETVTTVIYKIISEDPPPLGNFQKDLPEGLDYIVRKALAKAPESRYQSCREFIEDLRNYSRYAPQAAEVKEEVPEIIEPARTEEPISPVPQKKKKALLYISLASVSAVLAGVFLFLIFFSEKEKTSGTSGVPSGPPPAATFKKESQSGFEALLKMADTLGESGKLDKAIEEYQKLISLKSNDSRPYQKLGEIFEQKNDFAKAIPYFRQYLALLPEGENKEKLKQKINDLEAEIQKSSPPEEKPPGPPQTVSAQGKAVEASLPEKKEKESEKRSEPSSEALKKQSSVDMTNTLEAGVRALEKGDYEQAISLFEEVLKADPKNPGAQASLADAKKALEEAKKAQEIKNALADGVESYNKGNYRESAGLIQKVLSLNPNNEEARKYIELASLKLAPGEIKALVDQYLAAMKEKRLAGFYGQHCSPDLYQRIKRDAELFFTLYDNVQAVAANVVINFKDTTFEHYQTEVNFDHIITGLTRDKGIKQILFEGIYKWRLEKRGSNWTITDIAYESKQMK